MSPRTVTLEDGTQAEVPTEEELNALKTKAEKADGLTKTVEDLTKQKEALENDPVNKNWKAIRDVNEKLKSALKEQGKEVKEDGTIVEAPKALSVEEIEAKARKAAREEVLGSHKKTLLGKFDEEKRKVVEHYYNKLTAGEEVSADNMEKFISEAALLADPQSAGKANTHVNGQPPVFKDPNKQSFADTEAGKALADEVFGNESFTQKK